MQELNKDFAVVINRYGIGNSEVLDYCEHNDIDVLAKLPNDRRIATLYSRGELVYKEVPEFAEELKKIADYVLDLPKEIK